MSPNDESQQKATPLPDRRAMLYRSLPKYFTGNLSVRKLAKDVGVTVTELRAMVREEFNKGTIQIREPFDSKKSQKLSETFPRGPRAYYVVRTPDKELFLRAAAEGVLDELDKKLARADELTDICIGIVSGRTTGGVIRALCDLDWDRYLDVSALRTKTIHVCALNTCQTAGFEELEGNANILAYILAQKMKDEKMKLKTEAYGLMARIVMTRRETWETDIAAGAKDIICRMDPGRLRQSEDKQAKGEQGTPASDGVDSQGQERPDTEAEDADGSAHASLDQEKTMYLVIAGVGSKGGSLFSKYLGDELDDHQMKDAEGGQEEPVGDISYNPVTARGEEAKLKRGEEEICFYTALTLTRMHELAQDDRNMVVLIARNESYGEKDRVIIAAIGRDKCYGSVLITDSTTARQILLRFG